MKENKNYQSLYLKSKFKYLKLKGGSVALCISRESTKYATNTIINTTTNLLSGVATAFTFFVAGFEKYSDLTVLERDIEKINQYYIEIRNLIYYKIDFILCNTWPSVYDGYTLNLLGTYTENNSISTYFNEINTLLDNFRLLYNSHIIQNNAFNIVDKYKNYIPLITYIKIYLIFLSKEKIKEFLPKNLYYIKYILEQIYDHVDTNTRILKIILDYLKIDSTPKSELYKNINTIINEIKPSVTEHTIEEKNKSRERIEKLKEFL